MNYCSGEDDLYQIYVGSHKGKGEVMDADADTDIDIDANPQSL
eukprot:XP_001709166.1 Hypothetical protein GL50803_10861 [Giardia lamblia ATCC 50803]